MKIELNLVSDSYNSNCDHEKLSIEFFDHKEWVWVTIGDREVSVNKADFKRLFLII